jgi:UDP-N-acetylmuramate dehydrogenase
MKVLENINLIAHNSFGIPATAQKVFEITHPDDLADDLINASVLPRTPLILGGGSNVLFTTDCVEHVLLIRIPGIKRVNASSSCVHLQIGAGELWDDVVDYCVQHQLYGIENLSLIPGLAGAAPIQNIGAYGVEIKDTLHSIQAWDRHQKQHVRIAATDCQFGYRDSRFKHDWKHRYIITHLTLRLHTTPHFSLSYPALSRALSEQHITPSLQRIRDCVIQIRQSKLPDPKQLPNAGSFFKNPIVSLEQFDSLKHQHPHLPHFSLDNSRVKIPAAWLIEQCGFKGYRSGDVGVHQHQALVLVNYNHAPGTDILRLATEIQTVVEQRFGITLNREVNVIEHTSHALT